MPLPPHAVTSLLAHEPATGSGELLAQATEAQFVQTYLSQNRKAQLGLLLSATLIALIWIGRAPAVLPMLWLGVFAVVSSLRWRFTQRFVVQGPLPSAAQRVGLTLLVNGLLMAIPLSAFPAYSELERLAISIILMATATASTATTAGYKSLFLAFAAPMLIPLAIAWAMQAEHDPTGLSSWGIAVLVTVYLGFLVSLGKQVSTVFEQSCAHRLGEQRLNAELKAALQSADESSRAKTQFLAAASHDLRQPLHSINVLVAALSLSRLDDKAHAIVSLLDTVNQSFSRQLDGLLDLSKLDAGAVEPNLARQALAPLLHSMAQGLAPVAAQKHLALVTHFQPGIDVLTDDVLLGRVVSNLTDNAMKFTPEGGTIRLTLWQEGGSACIEVADTGIGIAAQDMQKVFDEFYQVANTERDRSRGLGLGLSIVRRLCRMLHIGVTLNSSPGTGTTVRLTLPALPPDTPTEPAAVAASAQLTEGCHVLVVDDEAVVRQSMQLLLEKLGCQVFLAEGTADALAVARAHTLDVVIADYRLREHDSGLETLGQLKALQPHVVTALVTGDTAPERIQAAQRAGVQVMFKPVPLTQLIALLQSARRER